MKKSQELSRWGILLSTVAVLLLVWGRAGAEVVWSSGEPINEPTVSQPTSGQKFGLGTLVHCTCNTPTNSDDWCDADAGSSGSNPDNKIKATWWAVYGTWENGINTGTSVTLIAPSNTGTVSMSAKFDDEGTTQYNDTHRTDFTYIEVVPIKMIFKVGGNEASSITRCQSGTFEVVDSQGDPVPDATYSNWHFEGEVDVSDSSNTSSNWTGTIVERGTAFCTVTTPGAIVTVSKTINVDPRSGWSITPDCDEDNVAGWVKPTDPHGGFPGLSTVMGQCRNMQTDDTSVFWPRGTNFENAYSTAEVTSGPNKGVWYIQSSTLSIPWETLVNKYAKSGTTPPTPPGTNFHEYNEGKGVSADTVLQRIKNHEYRGTGGNGEGHFAYLEAKESEDGMDGLAEIEDNAGSSEFLLKVNTWLDLYQIEAAIQGANHEPPAGSNWDGNVWRFNFDASPAVWQQILWKM